MSTVFQGSVLDVPTIPTFHNSKTTDQLTVVLAQTVARAHARALTTGAGVTIPSFVAVTRPDQSIAGNFHGDFRFVF